MRSRYSARAHRARISSSAPPPVFPPLLFPYLIHGRKDGPCRFSGVAEGAGVLWDCGLRSRSVSFLECNWDERTFFFLGDGLSTRCSAFAGLPISSPDPAAVDHLFLILLPFIRVLSTFFRGVLLYIDTLLLMCYPFLNMLELVGG